MHHLWVLIPINRTECDWFLHFDVCLFICIATIHEQMPDDGLVTETLLH